MGKHEIKEAMYNFFDVAQYRTYLPLKFISGVFMLNVCYPFPYFKLHHQLVDLDMTETQTHCIMKQSHTFRKL